MTTPVGFQIGLDIATALSIIAASITYVRAQSRSRIERNKQIEKALSQQRCDQAMQIARETVFSAVKSAEEFSQIGINLMQEWKKIDDLSDFDKLNQWVDNFTREYAGAVERIQLIDFKGLQTKIEIILTDKNKPIDKYMVRFNSIFDDGADKIASNSLLANQMARGFKKIIADRDFSGGSLERLAADMVATAFIKSGSVEQPVSSLYATCLQTYKKVYEELLKINLTID